MRCGWGEHPDRDAGMVTAETALVLPVLVAVLAAALQVLSLGIDTVRCVDAARAGARAAARGDDGTTRALALAPAGSAVTVRRAAGDVVVVVRGPRPAAWLPGGLTPHAEAVAAVEEPLEQADERAAGRPATPTADVPAAVEAG